MGIREIIFRGKEIDTGKWAYGNYYYEAKKQNKPYYITWNGEDALGDFGDRYHPVHNVIVEPETIGQFTGLCDKNGTKIFEGDIVELCCIRTYCGRQVSQYDKPTKVRAVIKFGECWNGFGIGFNFDYNNEFNEKVCEPIGKEQENREIWKRAIGEFVPKEYKKEITHPNWVWKNHFEVIGNIHDNPELLEKVEE